MKVPNTKAELEVAIESLIASYLDGVHQAARQAVERALAGAGMSSRLPQGRAERPAARKSSASRRSAAALDDACEALCSLVRARPGSSMVELGEQMGADVRALRQPMAKLKSAGRVRSVGARQLMRYFPAVVRSSSSKE
jgi:hypothetical protein